MKSEIGITLIALIITIIVIMILAGIGIGSIAGNKGNINVAKNNVSMSDLAKVQQAILETYVKYQQTGNLNSLFGTKVSWNTANTYLQSIVSKASDVSSLSLQGEQYSEGENKNADEYYYKLNKDDLEKIGLNNSGDEAYIVNYSTGEVFNIESEVTAQGNALYINIPK